MRKDYWARWSDNPSKRGRVAEFWPEDILVSHEFQLITRYKIKSLSNEPSDIVFLDPVIGCIYLAEVKTREHFGYSFGTVPKAQIKKLLESCVKMMPLVVLPLVIIRGRHSNWYLFPYDTWERSGKRNYKVAWKDGLYLSRFFPGVIIYDPRYPWERMFLELP